MCLDSKLIKSFGPHNYRPPEFVRRSTLDHTEGVPYIWVVPTSGLALQFLLTLSTLFNTTLRLCLIRKSCLLAAIGMALFMKVLFYFSLISILHTVVVFLGFFGGGGRLGLSVSLSRSRALSSHKWKSAFAFARFTVLFFFEHVKYL